MPSFLSEKKLWWCSLVCLLATVQGFAIHHHRQQQSSSLLFSQKFRTTTASTTTTLFGRKKGGLGSISADGVSTPSKVKKTTLKQRSKRKSGKEKKATAMSNSKKQNNNNEPAAAAISPALAEWMASQEEGGGTAQPVAVEMDDDDNDDVVDDAPVVAFQTFEKAEGKQPKGRRIKQSERKELEAKRAALVKEGVDTLMSALEENGNLNGILTAVDGLLQLPSDNLRVLLTGKQRYDYRLAWVGGDDAVCHVGTGLHKVPLARLQEVFMSCLGRNRMEVLEVIRILGPFPNVKNILQGTTKIGKGGVYNDDVVSLNIVMDSMVDGTGKEILAGKDENIRNVDLQVYFADERAIVAVVPPEDGGLRENPLEDNGVNVLVFVKEGELEEKLDALRVL